MTRNPSQNDETINEVEEIEVNPPSCTACGKGNLSEVDIGNRVLVVCDLCDYRKTYGKPGQKT